MRRAQAIVVLLALISAPLALPARSEACADACVKSCCLAMHHGTKTSSPAASHCHGAKLPPLARCCDEPATNHGLDYGFTILNPLTILPTIVGIEVPALSRAALATVLLHISSPSPSAPFEPPRA